jgi:outer membrane protein OmpA-like peptidoglycan-associated protein
VTFVTHGYGEENPVAPNMKPDGSDDPEGRQKNRRVQIILKKKG